MKTQQNSKIIEHESILKNQSVWGSIYEFLNDFFGSLVPGIYFSFFITACVLTVLTMFNNWFCFVENTVTLISPFSFEILICFLIFSFVIGSVFYRRDLKGPDRKSAEYIYKKDKNQRDEMAVRIGQKDKKLNVDYPYLYIYEYLKIRGLDHLAKRIPWRGTDTKSDTHRFKTKNFINILKTRLNYLVPEQMRDIVKNEAHIRLISSLWYITKWIFICSIIALLVCISAFIFRNKLNGLVQLYGVLVCFVWNVFQVILVVFIRNSIKKFYHYQRVREIVCVLETAYLASKRHKDIFDF